MPLITSNKIVVAFAVFAVLVYLAGFHLPHFNLNLAIIGQ